MRPDESAWAVLTAAILQIEKAHAEFGQHTDAYRSAKINLGRYCPMIIRWLGGTLPDHVDPNGPRWWNAVAESLANADINTACRYDAFQCSYPMWHRDRVHANVGAASIIRFTVDGSVRDTQVNAYQQGHRPIHGIFQRKPERSLEPTESMLRRYQRILNEAAATDSYGFRYKHSYELARRTYSGYARLFEQEQDANMTSFSATVISSCARTSCKNYKIHCRIKESRACRVSDYWLRIRGTIR